MITFLKKFVSDITLIFSILCVIGLIYFHSNLVWISIGIAAILTGFIPAIVHEDWTHKNIIPKNLWIKYIFDLVAYLVIILPFQGAARISPRLMWTKTHLFHHKVWRQPGDFTQKYIDEHTLLVLLFTTKFKKPFPLFDNDDEFKSATNQHKKELDKISLFIDNYYTILVTSIHLICLLTLGVELYFYILLLPTWISVRAMIWFGDILPHRNIKTKEEERDLDLSWLGSSAAYHISHHYHPNDITVGKGQRKYFNIMFYIVTIFYVLSPNSKFRN